MDREVLLEQLFEALINGDRPEARRIVDAARRVAPTFRDLVCDLFWPAHELLDKMHRSDQISTMSHHFATRLLRVIVDQTALTADREAPTRRSVLAVCGPSEGEELGAQMAVDMLECSGFVVRFAGGGAPPDEILSHVNQTRPDVLLLFSSAASDLPAIRQMVDSLREVNACPSLQIAVGGGVFNRADGLAEEIGADLWASNPLELAERLIEEPERRAVEGQRTVGRKPRKKAA